MKTTAVAAALCLACAPSALRSQVSDVPEGKRTSLGLYVTAVQAHDMWRADQDHVVLIDTRTPEEYAFVGHPPMAINVPGWLVEHKWDAEKKNTLAMRANPSFVDQVRGRVESGDTILVMCRSGGRSAKATELLAQAGFAKVYNVIDGFEGDVDENPHSAHFGKRLVNGWKNAGLPWTYDLDPESMVLPTCCCEPAAAPKDEPSRQATVDALTEAIEEEYRSRATYARVIEVFGAVRPFSSIVEAENRHVAALRALFETMGVETPTDRWAGDVEVPASLRDALRAAVDAELGNAAMYDRLLESTTDPAVRAVFARLRDASRERHLPAFRRHLERMSGA